MIMAHQCDWYCFFPFLVKSKVIVHFIKIWSLPFNKTAFSELSSMLVVVPGALHESSDLRHNLPLYLRPLQKSSDLPRVTHLSSAGVRMQTLGCDSKGSEFNYIRPGSEQNS
jgi:hypothetical protein